MLKPDPNPDPNQKLMLKLDPNPDKEKKCPIHNTTFAALPCSCCMSLSILHVHATRTLGSSDFEKFFENCFASCSFELAKDI